MLLLNQCTTQYQEINAHTPCVSQTCLAYPFVCKCTKTKVGACFCPPPLK